MRRVLRLAAVAGLAAAGLAIGPVGAAHASTSYVAIVIAGDKTACVPWHSGITGDDVLRAVASVSYRYDGLINQIDGVPADKRADDTHFWAYWHNLGKGWVFSDEGAGTYLVPAGSVEGWAYGDQAKPPLISYGSICHITTTSPPASKSPTTRPPSTTRAPAPAGHTASSPDSSVPYSGATAPVQASPTSTCPTRLPRPSTSSTETTPRASLSSTDSPSPSCSTRPPRATGTPSKTKSALPPSIVDSPSLTSSPVAAERHHSTSAAPAAGTAAGIVAAAAIGGVAFWRMRRQDGN
jgi:hypothetical protein